MNPTYRQLFEMVAKKLEDSQKLLFDLAVQDVIKYIESFGNPADWQDYEIDGDTAVVLYSVFIYVLGNKAVELESIPDDPVWDEANEILEIIRQTLEETHDDHDLTLDKKTLLPPYRQAEQAGLVTLIEGADGQKYIDLTPLCKQLAEDALELE